MKLRNVAGKPSLIVKSKCGNEGKVVRCIRPIGINVGFEGSDWWEIDAKIVGTLGTPTFCCRDSYMVPLSHDIAEEDLEVYHQEPVEAWWN